MSDKGSVFNSYQVPQSEYRHSDRKKERRKLDTNVSGLEVSESVIKQELCDKIDAVSAIIGATLLPEKYHNNDHLAAFVMDMKKKLGLISE